MIPLAPVSVCARLLHGALNVEKAMALLQAFFDESGTDGKSPVVAIAGYVGTEDDWVKVESNWLEALRRYGVRVFHMTHFMAQRGEFSLMDTPRRESMLTELTDALHCGSLTAISVAVDAAAYPHATTEQFRTFFPKPYDLCFNDVIRKVDFWSEAYTQGREVGLVFASHPGHDDRSRQNWERYKHVKTIGGLQFNHPDKVPALQCADMLVNRLFAVWKTLDMKADGTGTVAIEPILKDITALDITDDSVEWTLMGEAALRKRVANTNWHDPLFPCPVS